MRNLIALSTSVARRGLLSALLVGLAGVGLPPSISAQQPAPEELTCAEMGVQDQQASPEARQLYRQADRTLDEVEPASVEAAELAGLYLEAAQLDTPCSAERVTAYRVAARLLSHVGAHERAQQWMGQAAEVALTQGRTVEAIHSLLDAAEAAVQTGDERAFDHVERAVALKRSNDVDSFALRRIEQRLQFDSGALHLTSLIR